MPVHPSNKERKLLKLSNPMAQRRAGFYNFPSEQSNMRIEINNYRAISDLRPAPDQSHTKIIEAQFQRQGC